MGQKVGSVERRYISGMDYRMWSPSHAISQQNGSATWLGFSPDGEKLAISTSNGWIEVYSSLDFSVLNIQPIHATGINFACWSRDSKFICTASDDKSSVLLSAQKLKTVQTFVGHKSSVLCCDISPTSARVVTGGSDASIRIWEPSKSHSVSEISAHTEPISSVHFSHDGEFILTGSFDGLCRLWNTYTLVCVKTFVISLSPVSFCTFSPNSCYLLAFSTESSAQLIDIFSSSAVAAFPNLVNSHYMLSGGFISQEDPSKVEVFASSEDSCIIGWDLQSRKEVWRVKTDGNLNLAACVSPNGKLLAIGAGPGATQTAIWSRSM